MNHQAQRTSRLIMSTAAVIVIIAGMRAAADILIPFFLSVFIAAVCHSPLKFMQKRGVPKIVAIGIIVIAVAGIFSLITTLITSSVREITQQLPFYEERMRENITDLLALFGSHGYTVADQLMRDYFNAASAMRLVTNMLSNLGRVLTNSFLIILTVVFMLLEISSFPKKIRAIRGGDQGDLPELARFSSTVNRYMAIKTIISLATGVVITVFLLFFDVDFALLWGLLAFLLNYVPTIGSIIAAIPATILAFIQLGWLPALVVASVYLGVNTAIGNFIEPRYMGKGLGLSTLVVFLSLIFWGWVLGPVGMLLSVPLTMTLKIALEHNQNTRWLAIFLGNSVPADPSE